MIQEINLSVSSNGVNIYTTKELDYHKQRLFLSKSDVNNLASKLKGIHDTLKTNKAYKGVSLDFGEIDSHDSCDSFDVPCLRIRKGERTVTKDSYSSNDIPKGWTENIRVSLDKPTQIGIIVKALNSFMSVSDAQKRQIRKALSTDGNITFEL